MDVFLAACDVIKVKLESSRSGPVVLEDSHTGGRRTAQFGVKVGSAACSLRPQLAVHGQEMS